MSEKLTERWKCSKCHFPNMNLICSARGNRILFSEYLLKEDARHIVKLHNDYLKKKKK